MQSWHDGADRRDSRSMIDRAGSEYSYEQNKTRSSEHSQQLTESF